MAGIAAAILALADSARSSAVSPSGADARVPVLIVGMQHFVSRANVYNVDVGDVRTPKRRREIGAIVASLLRFHPTIVVVERTHGTSDIARRYREFLRGRFALPADEPYQIGFRVAEAAHVPEVAAFAQRHAQERYLRACKALSERTIAGERRILEHGTLGELLRFINSSEAVRENAACYAYLDRIGDDRHPVGQTLVTDWYARNLRLFANLTHLIRSKHDRILVLYGQGHMYLLQQLVDLSPDLRLVLPQPYLP